MLQVRLWPLLGISPAMHNAGFAWIHFRQYVLTRHPGLISKTKALLKRLAQLAQQQQQQSQGGVKAAAAAFGAGAAAGTGAAAAAAAASGAAAADMAAVRLEEGALTREVGTAVIDWITERLCDYHTRLSAIGGAGSLPGLVDVLAFAALSRGDSSDEVGDLLSAAVRTSVDKELKRRLADQGPFDDDTAEVAALCSVVRQLAEEELQAWAVGFAGQLLESAPLSVAVLHQAVGARLTAWVSGIRTLDDDTCAALRAAMDLEPMLLGPVTSAADGCHHSATRDVLRASRSWDTPTQLLPVLQEWVSNQTSGFMTWVDRQLQQEDWKPLGTQQAHSASAREVRRIVMESLDALFGLDLPLPESIVRMHMEGIDNIMHRYRHSILNKLGSWAVMVPAVPQLTRYKREMAIKQEEAEAHMSGLPLCLPAPGTISKKGISFLESVRRIDQEPCFRHIEELSNEKLVVMMASLGYLLDTLQPIAEVVSQRWQEISGRGTARRVGTEVDHSNPFSSAGCDGFSSSQSQRRRHGSNGKFAASSAVDAGPAATWGGGWGAGVGAPGGAGLPGGQASTAAVHSKSSRGQEHFASMLEAAEQSLRSGVVSVMKWLSVRVVWWEQRAGWCELLYRHRVIKCRLDWLLEGLSNTLGDVAALLPQEPRLEVAAALLKEAVLALERALLDGGPCRWYIPADVTHLADDLEDLRRLFFAEGDGLQMQDINANLAGLSAVLKLMSQHTGPLVEAHRAARRAALLSAGGLATDPAARAAAAAGSTGSSTTSAFSRSEGPWGAKSRMGAAAAAGATAGGASYSPQHTGGSVYAVAAAAGSTGGQSSSSSPRSLRVAGSSAGGVRQSVLALVAAGVDVGRDEHVLLRVLCHRADHAASKYLKESEKVPKARDETIGEALGRFTRIHRH